MDIKKDIYDNYFFTSHINNLVADETKPYSIFGYDNARVFKDMSTDSFVENIFNDKNKLLKFIDYTFYSIYSKIPNIHKLMYVNGYFMDVDEYITVIFKGGNTMSFFFDIILDAVCNNNKEVFDFKLNKIYEYLQNHNVDLKVIDKELFYLNSENTVKDFFSEHKKKFKISDVDYTMYINVNNPIKYSVITQLYNKILINSLVDIRNFFDSYYSYARNNEINDDIKYIMNNKYLPFKSNDDPYISLILSIDKLTKIIKAENMENFYNISDKKTYLIYVEIDFIKIFFQNNNRLVDILLYGCDEKNYFNQNSIYYEYIINLRLMTSIFEYLELLQICFDLHKKYLLKSTVQNLLIITKKIISHHLDNKKRIILESKMYNIDIINDFIRNIASKYNKETNQSIYNTKYSLSFDKKDVIQKIKLIRKNPNTDLIFNKFILNKKSDNTNEIDIVRKNDSLSYSANDISLYNSSISNDKYYHYITYNNSIYNNLELFSRKFDLFRIKFNIVLTKPLIEIDKKSVETYNIPSEFVDVSIPSFQDINRKNFYKEVQEEGINILNYRKGTLNYYWNTYSIHQLFDDLLKILFGPTIIPWYDAKYDKRIIRLLLLFSFYKIEKSIENYNSACDWICFLTDILKLTNEMYIYAVEKSSSLNEKLFPVLKPFILGRKYNTKYTEEQSNIILNHILENIYYKLDELGYNYTVKVDDFYKDFELIIKFLIFYSYSMKKDCFFNVFNKIRQIAGLLPYETNKTITKDDKDYNIIDYNNLKFIELLKVLSNALCVILYFLNETNVKCKFKNLNNCDVNETFKNCSHIHPINYNFDSSEYKYYNNVIETNDNQNILRSKKYIIINKKNEKKY
jgi:hypothetical protein